MNPASFSSVPVFGFETKDRYYQNDLKNQRWIWVDEKGNKWSRTDKEQKTFYHLLQQDGSWKEATPSEGLDKKMSTPPHKFEMFALERNCRKAASWVPLASAIDAISFIKDGLAILIASDEELEEKGIKKEHQKLKGAGWITRGIVTLAGAGIIFVLADITIHLFRSRIQDPLR